jgi:DNA end-binding protein Ku
MQSLWAGPIVCGQFSIPVRLYPATQQRDVTFRQVHRADGGRVSFRRVCEECGRDVPYADVARGSARPDGEIVMLSDEDLASLPRERARRIEVLSFAAAGQIDAILAGRSYYLVPDAPGARAYLVFRAALARAGKVAVATVTLRQREAMAVLRARDRVLVLQTLLWPDEIRTADFPFPPESAPDGPELAAAAALIDAMTADFAPAGHGDRYRTELAGLVGAKAVGRPGGCS